MKSMKLTALVASAAIIGALAMNGCGQPGDAPRQPSPGSSSSSDETTRLLQLNERLKTQLGDAYATGWIQDFTLHVAVTTEAAARAVTAAGAIPMLAAFNAKALEGGLRAVAAWQQRLPRELAAAIHKVIVNGRAGNITLFVATDKMDAVKSAAAADGPAGDIPLVFKDSASPATPL